jgi:hypothetical protein
MVAAAAQDRKPGLRRIFMPDKDRLAELNDQIAAIRNNLRELTEQAAARSGAADENLAADRIAEQETQLASLLKQRDALAKS